MSNRRVVVTGMSVYSGSSCGKEEFFNDLYAKKKQACPVPEEYALYGKLNTKWYVPYPVPSSEQYAEIKKKMGKKASEGAIMAVLSAKEALEDAGIAEPDENTAVTVGVGVANLKDILASDKSMIEKVRYPRLTIPLSMPNSVSSWIAIMLGLHGENYVCSAACASGTMGIGMGYRHILNGYADMAICGGEECFSGDDGISAMGFSSLGALTASEDGDCAAFSEERSGFLYSEGAVCMLCLEEYEHARARNARIYAEITGYCANNDAYHVVSIEPEAKEIEKLLRSIKGDKEIDYYSAHGTGTKLNDEVEAKVIQKLWGSSSGQPFINSTKSIVGHSIGASGAIEAAVCCDSIYHGRIHGTRMKTPAFDLNVVKEAIDTEVHSAISASFGFGGHNCVLRFERCD